MSNPDTAEDRPGEQPIAVSVATLSACHVGLHFAVEHAASEEQADRFREVRREIFLLIREAVQKAKASNDA